MSFALTLDFCPYLVHLGCLSVLLLLVFCSAHDDGTGKRWAVGAEYRAEVGFRWCPEVGVWCID